jgi:hypothetical protein
MIFRYDTETDQDIATASDPVEDMAICMSGATSRTACGTVLDLNQRVCYTTPVAGCVDGLASSDVLTADGDSGGPWFTGHVAVGLTSGGAGSTSYFQPVAEALLHYGVWVL